jgi:hypothetical protein
MNPASVAIDERGRIGTAVEAVPAHAVSIGRANARTRGIAVLEAQAGLGQPMTGARRVSSAFETWLTLPERLRRKRPIIASLAGAAFTRVGGTRRAGVRVTAIRLLERAPTARKQSRKRQCEQGWPQSSHRLVHVEPRPSRSLLGSASSINRYLGAASEGSSTPRYGKLR